MKSTVWHVQLRQGYNFTTPEQKVKVTGARFEWSKSPPSHIQLHGEQILQHLQGSVPSFQFVDGIDEWTALCPAPRLRIVERRPSQHGVASLLNQTPGVVECADPIAEIGSEADVRMLKR